jgi:hypothetical protein
MKMNISKKKTMGDDGEILTFLKGDAHVVTNPINQLFET